MPYRFSEILTIYVGNFAIRVAYNAHEIFIAFWHRILNQKNSSLVVIHKLTSWFYYLMIS